MQFKYDSYLLSYFAIQPERQLFCECIGPFTVFAILLRLERTCFPTLTQRELATYNTWIYKIILTCPHISNHNTFFPFPNLKQHFGCSTSSSRAFETNSSLIIFPSVNVFLMYPLGGSDVHSTFYSSNIIVVCKPFPRIHFTSHHITSLHFFFLQLVSKSQEKSHSEFLRM